MAARLKKKKKEKKITAVQIHSEAGRNGHTHKRI